MTNLAQALKVEPQRVIAPGVAPNKAFTLRRLRRLTLWGVAAAGAVLAAVLASRSPAGIERIALILHRAPDHAPVAAATQPFDAQAATQQLAEAVRGLSASDQEIKSRLAAVEHDIDDVTGAISKQLQAADLTRRAEDGPTVAATAAAAASVPTVTTSAIAAAPPPTTAAETAAAPRTEFGADIGSGLTIAALRARWATLRAAHPQLLQGLEPIVGVKEIPPANRIELRLVVGPFAEAVAAAKLCASLALFGLYCQPTLFDGQHLAAR